LVPINPCGRVTDFARREYRTKCRFFKDSDLEVDVQVYRAAPGAPSLGFPSSFLSLDWTDNNADEPWAADLGEVWGEPRPYSFKGPLVAPNYDHVCGTPEEFATGCNFLPLLDVKYDDQGLPVCCGQPLTPFLGIELGLELPEEVEPGASCELAPVIGVGQVVQFDGPGEYFRFAALAGETHYIETLAGTRVTNDASEAFATVDCVTNQALDDINFLPDDVTEMVMPAAGGWQFMVIRSTGVIGVTYPRVFRFLS
jgi:hypothetical protein